MIFSVVILTAWLLANNVGLIDVCDNDWIDCGDTEDAPVNLFQSI